MFLFLSVQESEKKKIVLKRADSDDEVRARKLELFIATCLYDYALLLPFCFKTCHVSFYVYRKRNQFGGRKKVYAYPVLVTM